MQEEMKTPKNTRLKIQLQRVLCIAKKTQSQDGTMHKNKPVRHNDVQSDFFCFTIVVFLCIIYTHLCIWKIISLSFPTYLLHLHQTCSHCVALGACGGRGT